jgi:hypothetical protein
MTVGLQLSIGEDPNDHYPFNVIWYGTDKTVTGRVPRPNTPLNQGVPIVLKPRPRDAYDWPPPDPAEQQRDYREFVSSEHFTGAGSGEIWVVSDYWPGNPTVPCRVYAKSL